MNGYLLLARVAFDDVPMGFYESREGALMHASVLTEKEVKRTLTNVMNIDTVEVADFTPALIKFVNGVPIGHIETLIPALLPITH